MGVQPPDPDARLPQNKVRAAIKAFQAVNPEHRETRTEAFPLTLTWPWGSVAIVMHPKNRRMVDIPVEIEYSTSSPIGDSLMFLSSRPRRARLRSGLARQQTGAGGAATYISTE